MFSRCHLCMLLLSPVQSPLCYAALFTASLFEILQIILTRIPFANCRLLKGDYKWVVFGDDDTVFFPDGIIRALETHQMDSELAHFVSGNASHGCRFASLA